MVETTAKERMQRALRSRTRPAINTTDTEVGGTVELFIPTPHKGAGGWRGPATIAHIEEDGATHAKWRGGNLICGMQDIWPTPTGHPMLESSAFTAPVVETPFNIVLTYIKQMSQ